ncbi:hypothetical protein [Microbulbifer thermotolerans]|uniref:hypothetical protein n=1 Tax=Microbulbifer thermotolerans TaxID=252514 RepID=UPI00224AD029|nr:hypothetical protein [Microbulbifer thermotolerans]MCX2780428.1 hypothetical protein [Microbulbifer thermotolerans]MCX2805900.1 hypothetical protein [Microbulbifer thermotolerans]
MRTNSEIFDSYNQAPQRELRLVVVIDYDLPLYLTSHDDIEGLPANAILGCLQKVSSTSQRLYPEDGRAEIGSISFDVVDRSGQFSYVLRDELDNGRSIKGLTVRLYSGFKGLHWDDFRLEQTQIAEESVSYSQGGKYSVRCRDIQRVMREDIFTLNSTRLSANFLKGASTLHVFDTSGFEPNPHTAAYGDAPNQSVYYLKIKYSDGYEIVRATGKTDTTFTGVTRGLFGTVDRDHVLEEGADPEESGIEVEEYVYLEGPAPALAYMLLTGNIPGTTDTLPSSWHLGIDPQWVNLEEFENIGSDLFKPGDYTKGKILRFDGLEETDGKKFIETEINLCSGTYMPVRADGKLGCRRMSGVLANAGTVATITPDDVTSVGDLKYDLSGVRNVYQIQWSWYQSPTDDDGKYLRTNTLIDAESIQTHGEAKSHTLKFRGLHNSRHTFTTIKNTFDALRDRFAGPPLSLRLGLLPSKNDLEVGDIVRVSLPQVRDHSINGDQPYQWNFSDGTDGWTGSTNSLVSGSNGVLSVTCFGDNPYIYYPTPSAEYYQGSDYPYVKLRLRRVGGTPIAPGARLSPRGDGDLPIIHTIPQSFIDTVNEHPGEWFEYVADYSGDPSYMGATIKWWVVNIGRQYAGDDFSYEIDYIRLYPTADLDEYSLDRAMEVQRISVDQVTGAVTVDLFGSYQPAGYIPDQPGASTSAELPDSWYDDEGTEMTAAGLSIDSSGFLTADGTLTGSASSRAIYYYLGDLTIPAGRTLTVTDNVELRVRGVLQIDGELRGAPSNNGVGFLGSCRGGHGNTVGAPSGGYISLRSRGEVVEGRNEIMPSINIENNAGDLTGIPDDLRGSGGAGGGKSYVWNSAEAFWEISGFGGAGGYGGAGIVAIARGIAFGVSGRINTTGADGGPGNTQFHSVPGGSGGGGAPGGVLLLVDGTDNPLPVVTNSKIVACYGDSPSSPGNPGEGGNCLGTSAARVMFVPKSRVPYPDATDPYAVDVRVQEALDAAAEAQEDAAEALAELGDIVADGVLDRSEKLQVVREYQRLINEQAGIDAEAVEYGAHIERGEYDGALAALTAYLDGLTPDWDDATQSTPITRSVWDDTWTAVYDARQTLLNRIAEIAKSLADAAQNSADAAQSAADAAQAAADAAQQTADSARQDATDALGELGAISADNKLHPSEKKQVVREYNELLDEQSGIVAEATTLGITTEKTAYNSAVTALTNYLDGLSPAWDNTSSTTTIDRGVWDTRWQDVYSTRQTLLNEISARLKQRADAAQATADSAVQNAAAAQSAADAAQQDATEALGELGNIGSDSKLHPSEKLIVIREYNELTDEQSGIVAQATDLGITTEKTAYNNAISALTSYLGGLSPAWDNTGSVTSITRSTWDSKWQDVYSTRQALLDKISAVLKTRADNAQTTADDAASAASDAQSAADAAQADATQALGELGNIGADNKLHPSEKLIIIREYNEIIGEQSGIESEAESYGIATEKTSYTDAISSLTSYLNGLSPAWNNTGAVTTINRTTWNSKWADVYGARQVLLNKIANTAGQWADWSKITGVGKPEDGATVGATTAERILIESSAGIFLESFSDPNALENWEIPVGDGSAWVISSSTARVGGRNLYIGDNSGDDEAWLHSRLRIPFESEKLYRVEMRVYQESSGDPSGRVYLGVAGFDRDGNYCNKNGDAVLANSYYVAANGAQNTGAGWVVYYGYIRGFGSINGSNGGQSLASPGLMHPNVRYISPLVVANYSGVSGRTRVDYCRIDVIQVRDQRDLPQNVSAQASLPTSSAVLSASDAGSSAKINIAAHTVQYGGFTVNYNSGSISGLSYGTKYYVYVDDPDYSGGSVTYQVTTEIWQLAAGIGRRAIGTITTPTSGGGTTEPVNPWCVADGVWLRDGLLAEDCEAGDLLDCWDTGDVDTHLSPIQAVKSQDDVPCVTITTESGAQVICSRETPVTDEQGIVYLAQDCLGVHLGVLHEDEPMTWERVIAVECAGLRRVNKISVGGISYAAGVHPQHRVITHNIDYKP